MGSDDAELVFVRGGTLRHGRISGTSVTVADAVTGGLVDAAAALVRP